MLASAAEAGSRRELGVSAETELSMVIVAIAVVAVLVFGFFWRRNNTAH